MPAGLASAQLHPAVEQNHEPAAEHVNQDDLNALVSQGLLLDAFITAFDMGDELFEFQFNALDGGGADVGQGQRYTRTPRADLPSWRLQTPKRDTGPNGNSCVECHNLPVADGAGLASSNVTRDPFHTGRVDRMINRNTPHLHGSGALQVLAEEMTADLQAQRDAAVAKAQATGFPRLVSLESKGVSFGTLRALPNGNVAGGRISGVSQDLIVRPYQWKGNFASLRDFNRDASHQELGMQALELVGEGVDGDGDGIADEMTVGDQTALTIYLAAQPRPLTFRELASVGEIPPLPAEQIAAIEDGESLFLEVGCAGCHRPSLTIDVPIFSEPSLAATHRDETFPSGDAPSAHGLDPATPVSFDLTADQPDNVFLVDGKEVHLGAFETDGKGRAIVRLFGDLKRHYMGRGLAENIDETGNGRATFLTKELWGVGSTAPYMHDGRATTITEAIDWHGGEARTSRESFFALSPTNQQAIIAFLEDMTIFLPAEEE